MSILKLVGLLLVVVFVVFVETKTKSLRSLVDHASSRQIGLVLTDLGPFAFASLVAVLILIMPS